MHRSSESRNVPLSSFITRGNEGSAAGSVLFMGNAVIIRLCELMNARVRTLMQLQIMHISRIRISSSPPCLLSFSHSLSLSPFMRRSPRLRRTLAMNNGRTECCDLPRVINKDVLVPLTKPRSANLHPALNQYEKKSHPPTRIVMRETSVMLSHPARSLTRIYHTGVRRIRNALKHTDELLRSSNGR